ncbi:hypothetical protein HA466_0278980 [Hirschfeldia incana]|nr:hypothetical protein HA466_0278980 [Hirschfeldia incana]
MKISREHAESIEDIQEFFSYPWGRVAFDMLMGSIKERDKVALSQNTIAVKGFVLALQLVMVEAFPALTEVVDEICSSSESEGDKFYRNGHDIFMKKKSMNPAHGINVDRRCEAQVRSLIEADSSQTLEETDLVRSDEEGDSRVDNLVARIRAGYEFTPSKFRGGVRQIDVARMRESRKSTSKPRSGKYVRSNGPNIQDSIVVDAVVEKLKPEFKNVDQKVGQATAAIDGLEGKVVLQVKDMFAKFKDEMILFVKDMVRSLFSERVSGPCEISRIRTNAPTEVPAGATNLAGEDAANANIIRNVISNLSEYSTPPRSNRISQDENRSLRYNNNVCTGFECLSPEAATCALSANSQNRTRQNAFQQSLVAHNTDREKVTDDPTFSLGLTQEEQDKREEDSLVALNPQWDFLYCRDVDDNIEVGEGSRRIMSIFYINFYTFCSSGIQVGGVSVTAKDMQLLIERPRLLPPKVIDILIRVARLVTQSKLPAEGPRSAGFLDCKFVFAMNRTYTSNTALVKDSTMEKYIFVFVQMLPYLARYVGESIGSEAVIQCYDVARPKAVAQNTNPSDSGLMAVLLMATHALYGIEACKHITPQMLEEEGKRAAILAYELREQL